MSRWLVNRLSGVLDSRTTRRSFLRRAAMAATAMSVAPAEFMLRPVTAEAVICGCSGSQCDCSALCCDGYTEFCCTINNGVNACPTGSFIGGWWKADGSVYCNGPRYYIDCMAQCTTCTNGCGPGLTFCDPGCDDTFCRCALGSCDNRHAGCTTFRYGQCHLEINCSGRIVCRVASCTPPWLIDSSCSTVTFTDDNTANHNVACLQAPPPPQAAWTGWVPMFPPLTVGVSGAPAVASWEPGRLDVFVRGGDDHLHHQWTVDAIDWYAWEDLGAPPGGMKSSPAAVSWATNRIDVFAKGADGALWHKWWDGTQWQGWESRGGRLTSAPAVASWGAGRLDVFAISKDHALWHTWYDNLTWYPWESRGGYCLDDPAAVSWGPNRVDAFVIGINRAMFTSSWTGSAWSGWVPLLGTTWASGPTASSWAAGRLDVFAESVDPGNPMGHLWYDGTGWYEESRGGSLTAAPAAVSWGVLRIDTVVRGTDGNLYRQWYGS